MQANNMNPKDECIFVPEEELIAKENKNANHVANINNSLNYLKDASSVVKQLQGQQLEINKWQEYLNCFPLPEAYKPLDIYSFIEKIKYFENISKKNGTINWLLKVNERSILTQDYLRKDLTLTTLSRKNKNNYDSESAKNIDLCLDMVKRIEDFLENSSETSQYEMEKLNYIEKLKSSLQQLIGDIFNNLTYRILSSEQAYMSSINELTAEYCYQADTFQIHIWSLKNLPIRFKQLESSCFIANLHGVKLILSIPIRVMSEQFTMRAIHLNFDNISNNDEVFQQKIIEPSENAIFRVQDLAECLNKEWLMQLKIMDRVQKELLKKRQEYEAQLQLFKDQETKKTKSQEEIDYKQKTKPKKIKLPREPTCLKGHMFSFIREIFLKQEQIQYKNYLNDMLRNLDPDEINIKKYNILGGIYQLYQVQKAKHLDFRSFNMTLHFNNSKLEIAEDLVIPPCTDSFESSPKIYRRGKGKESPWFVLTIQLPEYLCYWGQPVACQYETVTKVKLSPVAAEHNPNKNISGVKSKLLETPTEQSMQATSVSMLTSNYLPFLAPEKEGLTNSKLKLQQSFNTTTLNTSFSNLHLTGEEYNILDSIRDNNGILNVRDFPLTAPFSKQKIMQMERYLIPRIISSFKFNHDIKQDELEEIQREKRQKNKIGILARKRHTKIEPDVETNHLFTLDRRQNNPERLIPWYAETEAIRLWQLETTDAIQLNADYQDPKTFAQLVKLIVFIKWWNKFKVRNIIDLKPFKSNFPLSNKHAVESVDKLKFKSTFSRSSIPPTALYKNRSESQLNKSWRGSSVSSKITFVEPSASSVFSTSTQDLISRTYINSSVLDNSEIKVVEADPQTYTYSHWTTRHIINSMYNKKQHTVVIETDRLVAKSKEGIFSFFLFISLQRRYNEELVDAAYDESTPEPQQQIFSYTSLRQKQKELVQSYFGLAFEKYHHFPFKFWKLEPSEQDPENEVTFTLETHHVRYIFKINENGIRCLVTEPPTTKYKKNIKTYMNIDVPIDNLKELKHILREKNLNIFPDEDASLYIEKGYFSPKHLATELHTYNCMAVNCTQIIFSISTWNRLATRRNITLNFIKYQGSEDSIAEVRITPEGAYFVEISEKCSDIYDEIILDYKLTWRNIDVRRI